VEKVVIGPTNAKKNPPRLPIDVKRSATTVERLDILKSTALL